MTSESKNMPVPVVSKLANTMQCKQGAVRTVRYNVDGNYCLTCGSDKSLCLWNPNTGVRLKKYSGHGYEVLDACASCDNNQLCSAGMDKTVILWDVATGNPLRKYRHHAAQVNCVLFNEEGTVIVSGSLDATIHTYDCRSRKLEPIQVMKEPKDSVTSLDISDHEILCGCADGHVRRYDIRMGQMYADYVGKSVTSVHFTRDGQCTLATTLNNEIMLVDKESGELLNRYKGHKNSDYKIDNCLDCKDTHVLGGSEDGNVYIWDLVEANIVGKLTHPGTRVVHSLSYHPTEQCLLTASQSNVYLWKNKYGQSMDTSHS